MTDETATLPDGVKSQINALRGEQFKLVQKEKVDVRAVFPSCILFQPPGIVEAAVRMMVSYKHYDNRRIVSDFNSGWFYPEKPAFCALWGDTLELDGQEYVELLAYIGPTTVGYPLLMSKPRFVLEYVKD